MQCHKMWKQLKHKNNSAKHFAEIIFNEKFVLMIFKFG